MSGARSMLRRLQRWYRGAAVMLLNLVVVLLLVQATAALVLWAKSRHEVAVDLYGMLDDDRMSQLYPEQSRAEVTSLWRALAVPFAYEPFTEFQEHPRTTRLVNVDAAGFRRVADQGPWPPDPRRINVFVFGGSTTFGYGVADADTIPSRLQPLLQARNPDVRVYNFGRGFYYSTQERILFERLLTAGHVPAVAIFIDGLNDFSFERDDTTFSERVAAAIEGTGADVSFVDWLSGTPLGRSASLARSYLKAGPDAADHSGTELGDDAIHRIIDRYLANKRLVEAAGGAYGVTTIFVWQPVPMYHYDPRFHFFASRGFFGVTRVRHGYEVMADAVRAHPVGGRFLWLADVQETSHDPLYVDVVHYAPRFSARLAALIDERIGAVVVDVSRGG